MSKNVSSEPRQYTHWTIEEAKSICIKALVNSGVSEINAQYVSAALVRAQCEGQPGHGLSRIPSYTSQVSKGKVAGDAEITLSQKWPCAIQIDAHHGFSYRAINLAVEKLPSICASNGIGIATIIRSHHFGQAGAHLADIAKQGYIAFMFGNAPSSVALWGGSTAVFGTNPIAFAAPAKNRPPIVIDMALSKVARGKVLAAREIGGTIPDGWALDPNGKPTNDPHQAILGTMLPIGGAKGAALALMIEIMSAAFAGGNLGVEASSLLDNEGPPPNLAHTILAIDPSIADPHGSDHYYSNMEKIINLYSADNNTRIPGDRRLQETKLAQQKGIQIPIELAKKIETLANDT